jgi:hypothetical protein
MLNNEGRSADTYLDCVNDTSADTGISFSSSSTFSDVKPVLSNKVQLVAV